MWDSKESKVFYILSCMSDRGKESLFLLGITVSFHFPQSIGAAIRSSVSLTFREAKKFDTRSSSNLFQLVLASAFRHFVCFVTMSGPRSTSLLFAKQVSISLSSFLLLSDLARIVRAVPFDGPYATLIELHAKPGGFAYSALPRWADTLAYRHTHRETGGQTEAHEAIWARISWQEISLNLSMAKH